MSENNAVAQTQRPQKPRTVQAALQSPAIQKKLDELLGKKAASFCSTLVQISRNSSMLAKADPNSVIGAAITAATLDLPINPNLGFAYVVPYKSEAQFQMGYKGFIQLALRTGQYAALNDCVVPKGALVSYNELTGDLVIDFDKAEEGEPDGYAFYFELVNGFKKTAFWSHAKVLAHAKRFSQAFRSGYGPWKDDFDSMALKTVVKNTLSKYGILSVEMQNAMESDQSVSHGLDDQGFDYADNAEETDNPLEKMAPAEDVKEEPPTSADVNEVDTNAEQASAEKEEATKGEAATAKVIKSLEVIEKHRPDDFKELCVSMNIPADRWKNAPDPYLAEMLERLNNPED